MAPPENNLAAELLKNPGRLELPVQSRTASTGENDRNRRSPAPEGGTRSWGQERAGLNSAALQIVTKQQDGTISNDIGASQSLPLGRRNLKCPSDLRVTLQAPKTPREPRLNRAQTDPERRRIKWTHDFTKLYVLGVEVMESAHEAMQVVFAKRKTDNRQVVIKIRYKPHSFRTIEDERAWRKGTEFLMNLPAADGVASIVEVLEDDNAFYIVMEKVDGMDLYETIASEGDMLLDEVRMVLRQIIQALVHLHSRNAVHKDLKLENIVIHPAMEAPQPSPASGSNTSSSARLRSLKSQGSLASMQSGSTPRVAKVIDFDTVTEVNTNKGGRQARAKDVVGTDQYIAPEAYGGMYSPSSDMYSVGVIGYRLICGKFPFHDGIFDDEHGDNWVGCPKMSQIQRRLRISKPDFAGERWEMYPQALDLISRLLSYRPGSRPSAQQALKHPFFALGPEPEESAPQTISRAGSGWSGNDSLLNWFSRGSQEGYPQE
eukprot:TRINITY_DN25910_c0_g1_i1.p1 TRINITY_DN25910_c0_g1~~TRINITY_DN25910_c0_g1_i1.p1  ORF type:complete len:489 (-),score=94.07 TRINITY_DN25910_c0_g1_i1:159-1625(-)